MAVLTSGHQVAARLDHLALTVESAPSEAVVAGTKHARMIIVANGARFHIRGRGHHAKRWPLTARMKLEVSGASPLGKVSGTPPGFWSIVEHGRRAPKGSYIIRAGGAQTAKGKALGSSRRRIGKNAANRSGSFAGATPMPLGGGRFSYVVRPGPHRPIGHPWQTSLTEIGRTQGEVMGRAVAKHLAEGMR